MIIQMVALNSKHKTERIENTERQLKLISQDNRDKPVLNKIMTTHD